MLDQRTPELQSVNESPEKTLTNEAKWKAVLSRNKSYDGAFVFGVRSTGIYCRPSCPAKRSKRENVLFFAEPNEAELSGFRPCRRCNPGDTRSSSGAEWVYEICSFIDANLGKRLTLSTLAVHAELSPV